MAIIEEIVKVTNTWTSHISWLLSPYRTPIFIFSAFMVIIITLFLFKKACRANAADFLVIVWTLAIFFSIYDNCAWGIRVHELFLERFLPLCIMTVSLYIGSQKSRNSKLRTLLIVIFGLGLAVYVYLFILTSVIPTDYIHFYGHEYRRASLVRDPYWCLAGSGLSYIASRFRPSMILLTAPFPIFYFFHLITGFYSPYSKTDVLVGTGKYYVYIVYLLFCFLLVSIVVGIYQRKKGRQTSCVKTTDEY